MRTTPIGGRPELREDLARRRADPLVGRYVVDALGHPAVERDHTRVLQVRQRDRECFGDLVGDAAAEAATDDPRTIVDHRHERALIAERAGEAVEHGQKRGLRIAPGQQLTRQRVDVVQRGTLGRSGHQPVTKSLATFRGAGRCRRRRSGHPARPDRTTGRAAARCRARDRAGDPEGFGVAEVRVDRRHDDAGFDRDEVDADERHADPGVDDDALVEDAVEDIDEARSTSGAFNGHVLFS
jgi:hypothetical protein